jgi:hypothetical protein
MTCRYGGGQGRGRTADLPIFRPNSPVRGGRPDPNSCSREGCVVPYRPVIHEVVLANPLADARLWVEVDNHSVVTTHFASFSYRFPLDDSSVRATLAARRRRRFDDAGRYQAV